MNGIPEGYIEIPLDTPEPLNPQSSDVPQIRQLAAEMSFQAIALVFPSARGNNKKCGASYRGWGCTRPAHALLEPHVAHIGSGEAVALWFNEDEDYRRSAWSLTN